MNILSIAYEVIMPIFLIVGVGMVVGRTTQLDPATLTNLLFYVLFPALILDGLVNTPFSPSELLQIGLGVLMLAVVTGVIAFGVARLLNLGRQTTSAFVLAVMLMNSANYGIPVNRFAFGEEGGQAALVFYMASVLISYTVGVYIASRGNVTGREALMNVFKLPLVYAAMLGLFLNLANWTLPTPIARATGLLAQGAVPTMLILLGIQLLQCKLQGNWRAIGAATGLRLMVSPIVALILTQLLGMNQLFQDVSIVQAGMPTAVFVGVLTTKYNSDAPFATAVILVSTLLSVISLTLILAWVG